MADAQPAHGFWGAPTALHTFCEQNYATTYFVAEFWNSLSSLLYCAAAAHVLAKPEARADRTIVATSLALFVTGLGSMAFHGTMLYEWELWDELPMLVFIGCALYTKAACLPPRLAPFRGAFTVCAFLSVSGSAVAYLVFQQYELFVISFTAIVAADLLIALAQPAQSRAINWLKALCLFCAISGKVIWEQEVRMCASEPRVWPLHVVWHVLSSAAAYYGLLANMTYRLECSLNPLHQRGSSFRLSYIAVPSAWPVVALHAPPSGRFRSKATAAARRRAR